MQCIYIKATSYTDDFIDYITKKLNKKIYTQSTEKSTILFKIDSDLSIDLISDLLTDYIIFKYEPILLSRIINSNYCYFNSIEKKEILAMSLLIIKNEKHSFFTEFFEVQRRNIIFTTFLEFLKAWNFINLEGFINFRLKDYIKSLEEIVEKAVETFVMEREYKEFIRLLKYFVDIQESKCTVVHIIVNYKNKYLLLDEEKREITNDAVNEFIDDVTSEDLNNDDWLISSLITLAPKKLIIHSLKKFKNKEILETIKNIFPDKVFICNDKCEFCRSLIKVR